MNKIFGGDIHGWEGGGEGCGRGRRETRGDEWAPSYESRPECFSLFLLICAIYVDVCYRLDPHLCPQLMLTPTQAVNLHHPRPSVKYVSV